MVQTAEQMEQSSTERAEQAFDNKNKFHNYWEVMDTHRNNILENQIALFQECLNTSKPARTGGLE